MTREIIGGDIDPLDRICLLVDLPVAVAATEALGDYPGVTVDTFDTDTAEGLGRACRALCDPKAPHCVSFEEAKNLIQSTDRVPVVVTEIEGENRGVSRLEGFLEVLYKAKSRLA